MTTARAQQLYRTLQDFARKTPELWTPAQAAELQKGIERSMPRFDQKRYLLNFTLDLIAKLVDSLSVFTTTCFCSEWNITLN